MRFNVINPAIDTSPTGIQCKHGNLRVGHTQQLKLCVVRQRVPRDFCVNQIFFDGTLLRHKVLIAVFVISCTRQRKFYLINSDRKV